MNKVISGLFFKELKRNQNVAQYVCIENRMNHKLIMT